MLVVSFSSSSQGLTPSITILDQDTNFCWNITQSKRIAATFAQVAYDRQIINAYERKSQDMQKAIDLGKHQQYLLHQKVYNLEKIATNQSIKDSLYRQQRLKLQRKIKKSRLHKAGLSLLSGLLLFSHLKRGS